MSRASFRWRRWRRSRQKGLSAPDDFDRRIAVIATQGTSQRRHPVAPRMVVELEPGFAHVQQAAFPLRHDVMGVKSGTESGSDPLTDGVDLTPPGRHDLAVEMVQELAIDRGVLVVNRRVLLASG